MSEFSPAAGQKKRRAGVKRMMKLMNISLQTKKIELIKRRLAA
jgi:hypothetical protein